ncbi:MAG TPA: hypothetical protein VGC76_16860 [Pyrinomonadaceae bacterium]|jgi:hypothetical protein
MSKKTITKFSAFVISFSLVCLIFSGCFHASSSNKRNTTSDNSASGYQNAQIIGRIKSPEIDESSGIAASKCQPGVFWTHNDSGDDAFIFAINAQGEHLGVWRVASAENKDWEDIAAFKTAAGECFLYVGDIGDNDRKRDDLKIYRVREPSVSAADKASTRKTASTTEPADVIRIDYADGRHDAETLMIHPQTGDIYVLSKRTDAPSGVYKLAANYNLDKTNTLKKIAELTVPAIPNGFLTGGDISPDGRRAILCDYFDAYEIALPDASNDFDEIWKQKIAVVHLGEREQGEAVGYSADGNSIFATSEKRNSPVIEVKKK